MTTINQLSKFLGDAREHRGMSVTDLAAQSGVARAALYRFANDGDIRLTTFLAMADTLGLDVVLAPKAVSTSLQAGVSPSPQTGPMSAVEARMAAIQAKLKRGAL